MRRASPPLHVLATAAATEANSAIIAPNMPLRGHGRGFSRRPYSGGRGQFVTGDAHFQSVRDVNLGFRPRESESFANQSRYQYPPYNPRRPPPYHQNPQFRQPRRCQYQQFRPRPPDYRDWEYAATQPPPDCERFIILSYNILADYLAIDHRGKLYFHIPRHMLDWQWIKKNLVFELGLWSADIMCLQEVDRFHDLVEEFKLKGYSGVWKMRTGNAVDGCAIFWRTTRFKLRHQESIEFSKLGLRDNVAQICVLELMNQNGSLPSSLTGSSKVVICNIHVLYNPNRGEIKLGQVRVLLERAKAVSEIWNDAPVVICGDFNCTPKSPLYNFISEQKLNLSGVDRDKVSGQASAVIHQPRLYGPNSSEGSANVSAQVTSIAHKKEDSVQQNNYSDMQKPDNQDNRAENQYTHTVLDITDKSSTDVQCEKGTGALYNAGKVTQQSAVDNSKIISQVDSIKESIASYSEGRFPVDHINNEIHDNAPMTSPSLEAAHTNAVSPLNPESSSENFDFDVPKENIHTEFDSCPISLGEDNQSFRVEIDPKPTDLLNVEVSSAKPSTQTSGSDPFKTPHAAYRRSPSSELIADDQTNCSSTSYQVDKSHQSTTIDFPLDETLETLSHDMFDKATIGSENIGEDDDAFISALHNVEEGFHPAIGPDLEKSDQFEELKSASDELLLHAQSDEVEDDVPLSLNSQSFDAERTPYNPSLWTPMEIKTATGNSDCTFLEHSLPLKSTYTEVRNCSGTRDPNGEPLVTSYNRCFLGTVDYIWRSEGLQTIRVLAPIPKDAMQWTPGFPTKKWGSDHIALVSELAFGKGVTNISRDVQ